MKRILFLPLDANDASDIVDLLRGLTTSDIRPVISPHGALALYDDLEPIPFEMKCKGDVIRIVSGQKRVFIVRVGTQVDAFHVVGEDHFLLCRSSAVTLSL